MTVFNPEFIQKHGFGGWDRIRPQSQCLNCKGTGRASGDPQDPNECGFCHKEESK